MFIGEFHVNFLGKGRVALPKKIRSQLSGGKVVLSRGFEKCIFGFEKKSWQESAKKQTEASITDQGARRVRRYLFSGAMVVSFDSQGRVVVPNYLLDYGEIGKDEMVVVIGAGDHFEIWSQEGWQKEFQAIDNKS